MNELQAKKEGVAAYRRGMKRAPLFNKPFMESCLSLEFNERIAAMKAYAYGYGVAMLADGWERFTPTPPPSVAALAAIDNA